MTEKLGICKDCKNRCGQMCVKDMNPKGEVLTCSQYKPLKNSYADLEKQLTEAKKIIQEFMRISTVCDEDFEPDYSVLLDKAENFLREEE